MYPDVFTEEAFALRLSYLRTQKKVSAREMSLSLGQNSSYINRIENLRNRHFCVHQKSDCLLKAFSLQMLLECKSRLLFYDFTHVGK